MCGRFTLRTSLADLRQLFFPQDDPDVFSAAIQSVLNQPRYNIAPTQSVAVIRQLDGDAPEFAAMRWGFIPNWADDVAIGARMINARSETIDEKRSFKNAFQNQRCLIPADGYYEWQKAGSVKQPYFLHQPDDASFAMAGLWELNTKASDDSSPIASFTVITTAANSVTGKIHDRMPVILDNKDFDAWLDPSFHDTSSLKKHLTAAAEDFFEITAVSRRVNHVANDGPECIEPVTPKPEGPKTTQATLFD
ncbi:protein containing DUF159 [Rhodopirellula maiorica SM1]|uniref:Abasic site processing protein n=1 Tax=Rhodopirellula maiorica SM1 TaxID=1265738 RepID=M5RCX8_9BACT|nr:SOS response-associated peptidase [Rhodopirellula maiorica]EMI16921.1 protein containing DUF159 [Rhodopirellula maiorica SM1]